MKIEPDVWHLLSEEERQQRFLEHRQAIDTIDRQLLMLVNQRARHAEVIGQIKTLSGDSDMYRPEREAQILRRHMSNNPGPLSNESIAYLFRELMSVCLALEKPLKIGYLGPEGTFSQQAAKKQFGGAAINVAYRSIDEVFRAVENGLVDYGLVPVENSTEGVINHTLDMFLESSVVICGETTLRIVQNLISAAASLKEIQTVYAHPQSLAQCRQWLGKRLPQADLQNMPSNAAAVQKVKGDPHAAALGGELAAALYEVPILATHIEDDNNNTTRFLVIGKKIPSKSGQDKTSVLVSAHDRPGLLFHLIAPLAKYQVTMTKIESRPSGKGLWGYVFFIDVEGHISDTHLQQAFAEIEQQSSLFKVLGSYPANVF